ASAARALRRRHGGHAGRAGGRRHLVRRPVRGRRRRRRLFRPLLERVWPGRTALPALRHADPARAVHEPRIVLVPAVPAAPAPAVSPARGQDLRLYSIIDNGPNTATSTAQ